MWRKKKELNTLPQMDTCSTFKKVISVRGDADVYLQPENSPPSQEHFVKLHHPPEHKCWEKK